MSLCIVGEKTTWHISKKFETNISPKKYSLQHFGLYFVRYAALKRKLLDRFPTYSQQTYLLRLFIILLGDSQEGLLQNFVNQTPFRPKTYK